MASTVLITVAGADVTNNVLYQSASFESQQSATPGTFEVILKDPDRTLGPFVVGAEITVDIDGIRHYGGYVTQVTRKFAFPADELPADTRQWVLRGVDYNILFDKRVTRRTDDYTRSLPKILATDYDGDLIKSLCANYLDLPAGLDSTTHVDNVRRHIDIPGYDSPDMVFGWKAPGTVWREQMELLANLSGAVWYIDPNMRLHFHAIEDTHAAVDFGDQPNGTSIIGIRDVTATEMGGPQMTNDAFVWGGSEWTEDVVFARAENATSIATHNRWQEAEHHFGEDGYKVSTQWRADLIVEGGVEARTAGFNPGKAYPQWNLNMTWLGEHLPAGVQVRAGQLVTTRLSTFGAELNPMTLPLRTLRISFVGVDDTGKGHAKFTASLGLQLNDPFALWGYLRSLRRARPAMVAAATDNTQQSTYGAFGQFEPVLVSGTTYELPADIGYIAATTQLYDDGILQQRDVDYTESDPVAGRITLTSAPSGDLWIVCRTT